MSPDEKITAIALEQNDPFARPGQLATPLPKSPFQQRDFSHLDDPADVVKKPKKAEVKEKKKPAVKAKVLQNLDVPESRPDNEPPCQPAEPADLVTESRRDGMPSYRTEFSGRDIMVGYVCYNQTNPKTAFAMLAMALDFGRDKIRFDFVCDEKNIAHARNIIAEKFLQTDAKYLLMLDDDIVPCIGRPSWIKAVVPSAKDVDDLPLKRHIVHRLLNSGKTLIGGAYFGRQEGATLMCSDQTLAVSARRYDDFLAPVNWIGTGCLLIHRSVFEDIRKKHPELATSNTDAKFDFFLPSTGHTNDGIAFCSRAKEAGHMPHIDLGTPVFHVGYKAF